MLYFVINVIFVWNTKTISIHLIHFSGHDSCQGDSGSPLIIRRDSASPAFLYGIVSFGTKICGSGVPGVYTRIETYIPWILSHLQP